MMLGKSQRRPSVNDRHIRENPIRMFPEPRPRECGRITTTCTLRWCRRLGFIYDTARNVSKPPLMGTKQRAPSSLPPAVSYAVVRPKSTRGCRDICPRMRPHVGLLERACLGCLGIVAVWGSSAFPARSAFLPHHMHRNLVWYASDPTLTSTGTRQSIIRHSTNSDVRGNDGSEAIFQAAKMQGARSRSKPIPTKYVSFDRSSLFFANGLGGSRSKARRRNLPRNSLHIGVGYQVRGSYPGESIQSSSDLSFPVFPFD